MSIKLNLGETEIAILQSATQIFSSFVEAGLVTDDQTAKKYLDQAEDIAIAMARSIDRRVADPTEIEALEKALGRK